MLEQNYNSKSKKRMHIFELSSADRQEPDGDESKEDFRFQKSLEELKDLRSQLHYAADYCRATFCKAGDKKMVVENTKEYICRAVVTLVDHLGNVSANLNQCVSKTNEFSEAELRINCFKQRLLLCEQYAHKLALTKLRWRPNLPRHHCRYLSTPMSSVERSSEELRPNCNSQKSTKTTQTKHEFDAEDVPLFFYTCSDHHCKSSPAKNNPPPRKIGLDQVLPVRDGLSILTKRPSPSFHFQLVGSPRLGRSSLGRKSLSSMQGSELLSLLRRAKRISLKNEKTRRCTADFLRDH